MKEIVRQVQENLLRQARRNRGSFLSPKSREILPEYEEDEFTCCGQRMTHRDFFHVRRYRCSHHPYHPEVFVSLSTGEYIVDNKGYAPDSG
jgi:hypothetical protein